MEKSPTVGPQPQSGFSLIEVTLSLAIIAFALVGIMALFPAAMKSARESQMETRATLLARQVFSDLTASEDPANTFIGIRPGIENAINRQTVNLSVPGQFVFGFDDDGLGQGAASINDFETGLPNPSWVYATRVSISTNSLPPGLSRVEVLVTAPAAAPLTNRSRFPFVTLLRNQ